MSVFMQPIYTQTSNGSTGIITFNNIPQGFTDLKLVMSTRGATQVSDYSGMYLRLNNDSSLLYSDTTLFAYNGTNTASTRDSGANSVFGFWQNSTTSTANTYSNIEIYFSNYAGGNYKSIIFDGASENNSSSGNTLTLTCGLYRNSAPITSITIIGDTFTNASTFTLYGISSQYAGQAGTPPTIGTVTDQAEFASVAFTPAANDQAQVYKVTNTTNSAVTFGQSSPIVAPATFNTATTYTVAAVNDKGTGTSSASASITTANSYTSIATGTGQNFTFNLIPQNYRHLQLRIFARNPVGTQNNSYIQFNGDSSGTGYSSHYITTDGATVTAGGFGLGSGYMQMPPMPGATSTAGLFGVAVIDILNYADTNKLKVVRAIGGNDRNGSGTIGFYSGYWNSLSAISTLTCGTVDGNALAGSHFALYGVA